MSEQNPFEPQETPEKIAPSSEGAYSSKQREVYFNNPEERRKLAARRQLLERIYIGVLGAIGIGVLAMLIFIAVLSGDLPSLEQLENPKPQLATEVYSADGVLLTKFFNENRTAVPIDSVSKHVVNALIATEDIDFYKHWGFDLPRFVKVMLFDNVSATLRGRNARGASTITQQLAKNLYLTPERSVKRKIKEVLTAIQIERTYTKREILELYLNTVFFGAGAYGVEAAAWTYFAKPASQLNVAESALLVAVLKSTKNYNPVEKPDEALERRNLVIGLMKNAGFISASDEAKYKATKLALNYTPVTDLGLAPYFTEYVRRQMQEEAAKNKLDLYRDGLVVYTTLDTRIQHHAESAIQKHFPLLQASHDKSWNWNEREPDSLRTVFIKETTRFKDLIKKGIAEKDAIKQLKNDKGWLDTLLREKSVVQHAFVAIDPSTGYIKAWVGGKDFVKYKFDHVWQAKRQPGSTFKPFVYTAAIDEGIPPNFPVLNQPIAIATEQRMWIPDNADSKSGGYVTLRDALASSLNQVTIRLSQKFATPDKVARYAKRMGIETPLEVNLAMALGASVVTPLEITSAYGTFANNGVHVAPIGILRVEDKFGNVVASYKPEKREALSASSNYVMVTMLKSVVDRGTAASIRSKFNFRGEAGGKTGTTQNQGDGWFMGFTPQLVAGVWTGFDDNRMHFKSMSIGQGSSSALPVWAMFMKACYDDKSLGLQNRYFAKPGSVVTKMVSRDPNNPTDMSPSKAYPEYFTEASLRRYTSLMPGADSIRIGNSALIPVANQKKRGEGQY